MAVQMALKGATVALTLFNAAPGVQAAASSANLLAAAGSPGGTLNDIRSRVGALEARLAETDEHNKQTIVKLQESLEDKLAVAKAKTRDIAYQNKAVSDQIKDVAKENVALRRQAKELERDNSKLVDDFQAFKVNWTTALEVTDHILTDATARPPELNVMSKLDAEEARINANAEHDQKIAQIDNALLTMSLLSTKILPSPQSLLGDLNMGLEDLTKEHDVKVARIKSQFAAQLSKELESQDLLNKELASLQGKLHHQVELRTELQDAVKILGARKVQLEKQAISMRHYLQRLAAKAMPTKATAARAHEEHEEQKANGSNADTAVHQASITESGKKAMQAALKDTAANELATAPVWKKWLR